MDFDSVAQVLLEIPFSFQQAPVDLDFVVNVLLPNAQKIVQLALTLPQVNAHYELPA